MPHSFEKKANKAKMPTDLQGLWWNSACNDISQKAPSTQTKHTGATLLPVLHEEESTDGGSCHSDAEVSNFSDTASTVVGPGLQCSRKPSLKGHANLEDIAPSAFKPGFLSVPTSVNQALKQHEACASGAAKAPFLAAKAPVSSLRSALRAKGIEVMHSAKASAPKNTFNASSLAEAAPMHVAPPPGLEHLCPVPQVGAGGGERIRRGTESSKPALSYHGTCPPSFGGAGGFMPNDEGLAAHMAMMQHFKPASGSYTCARMSF